MSGQWCINQMTAINETNTVIIYTITWRFLGIISRLSLAFQSDALELVRISGFNEFHQHSIRCWRMLEKFYCSYCAKPFFPIFDKEAFFLLRVENCIDRTCLDFQDNFRNSWRNSNDSLKSFWDLLNFSRSSLKSLTVLRFDRFIPFLFVWWSLIAESWWQIIHNRSQLREHNRIFEKGIASLKKERRMRVMDEIHNESVCLRLSAFVYGSE